MYNVSVYSTANNQSLGTQTPGQYVFEPQNISFLKAFRYSNLEDSFFFRQYHLRGKRNHTQTLNGNDIFTYKYPCSTNQI